MRARIALLVVSVCALSGCSSSSVPGFCGASDEVRLAVADVPPAQYPAEAGKHVQTLRDSAADLSGDQSTLAAKVVADLEKAAKAEAGSIKFTNAYNRFVRDSNRFDHKYCNQTEAPEL